MKKKKVVFYSLMFFPLVMVLVALPFLPVQIPAHYDFNNQVTRWGSKYEALIFPALTIFFGFFMLGMARYAAKHEESGKNNESICITTGIVSLFLFNAMTVYFLYTDFNQVENLAEVELDVNQIIFGIFGISMIIIGNLMPKLRMNSMIGLRTSWSMKNETVWKKSQRFGGISFIAGGIALIVVCFLTRGDTCMLWSMGIFAMILIVDVYYTYRAAGQTPNEEDTP